MDSFLTISLLGLGALFLVLACFGWGQPRVDLTVEHWSRCVAGLSEPADLFYARVYQRLKARLTQASLPDSRIGFGPGHLFGNGTIFGARPRYLIIRYADTVVYVYAFPLPDGLFVSYWAFSRFTLWLEHPLLKYFAVMSPKPVTLYRYDVMELCLTVIHSALFEVIDEYCLERGLAPLEEHERRPVLHSFYAKYKQGHLPPIGYAPSGYVMPVAPVAPLPSSGPTPLPSTANPPMPNSAMPNPSSSQSYRG
jgi:hypothetical protein